MITDDECNQCKKKTTDNFWCHSCNSIRFKEKFDKWTSGNNDVDNFIQKAQLEAASRFKTLEWIPYEKFENIEKIGEGGFATVYSAEWKEGYILYWSKYGLWKRSGEIKVALKCLKNSQEITKEYLKEVKNLHKLSGDGSQITRCYGITKDNKSNFMIVMKFVDHIKVIHEISWKEKFKRLHYTALGLYKIHKSGLVHHDFHPGNILFSNKNDEVYITDLGLCKPANSKESENKIYGVLPYVAPEVFHNKTHTKAADIYSFGMVMCEVFSGVSPFSDVDCENEEESKTLAIKICNGIRPEIQDLPPLIVKLIKKCWDADSARRPSAEDLCKILNAWKKFASDSKLNRQINACEVNQAGRSLNRTSEQIHTSQLLRTSKLLDFENLPLPKNSKLK